MRLKIILAFIVIATTVFPAEGDFRLWTSSAGTTTNAKLVNKSDKGFTLITEDGRRLVVNPQLLSLEDRNYAESWLSPKRKMRDLVSGAIISKVEHGVGTYRHLGFDNQLRPGLKNYSQRSSELFARHYSFSKKWGSVIEVNDNGLRESRVTLLQLLIAVESSDEQDICARILSNSGGVDWFQEIIGKMAKLSKECNDEVLIKEVDIFIESLRGQREQIMDSKRRSDTPAFSINDSFKKKASEFSRYLQSE